MRFIGPRPEVESFVTKEKFYFLKFIKPGLTDYSSILLKNEENILKALGGIQCYPEILKTKTDLGALYLKDKGFRLDLVLAISTLLVIIYPKFIQKNINKLFIKPHSLTLYKKIEVLNKL